MSTSLSQILKNRLKILVRRDLGGLGDILMHRMIFEDFKLLCPEVQVTFACPSKYTPAIDDHPFIDHVISTDRVNESDYGIVYNTSQICALYEFTHAPFCDMHRSDIWADFCGLKLTKHDMHIQVQKKLSLKNTILIAPMTAMASKNLDTNQIVPIVERLKSFGFKVMVLHNQKVDYGCETLSDLDTKGFIAAINECEMLISADTAAFHCATGLDKPVVAIFGWADGKVYSKYARKCVLVQKHRDEDPNWCGPCYNFNKCIKDSSIHTLRKPCITELGWETIWRGVEKCLDQFVYKNNKYNKINLEMVNDATSS